MSRKKLLRFEHNSLTNNVLEPKKDLYKTIKGKWNEAFFELPNPIVLELACGKGEYSVGLAKVFPEKNFVGIDVKGDRIAVGSKNAIANNIHNVGFLRANIFFIEDYFAENEVSEIWITFPDPFNLKKNDRRRLTHIDYLKKYERILKQGGTIHLKTDNRDLFEFSIRELLKLNITELHYTYNLYNSHFMNEHFGIKTRFEGIFTKKGFDVHYLKCKIG